MNYWIYGKHYSGKTTLARQIAGPDAPVINFVASTPLALERILGTHRRVVLDEYSCQCEHALNLLIARPGGTSELVVVVATVPPPTRAIRSCFYTIKLKRPGKKQAQPIPKS